MGKKIIIDEAIILEWGEKAKENSEYGYTQGYLDALTAIQDAGKPLEEVIKPMLEEAFEEGKEAYSRYYDHIDDRLDEHQYNFDKRYYISQALENLKASISN